MIGGGCQKRRELIENKIRGIAVNLQKLTRLKQTRETKDIIQASLDLCNYVLPVLKNEYIRLARLYDEQASPEAIRSYTTSIDNRYASHFQELYIQLAEAGKIYADKNNLKGQWDIKTSPL